jgi:hypothetical protein
MRPAYSEPADRGQAVCGHMVRREAHGHSIEHAVLACLWQCMQQCAAHDSASVTLQDVTAHDQHCAPDSGYPRRDLRAHLVALLILAQPHAVAAGLLGEHGALVVVPCSSDMHVARER